MLRLKKQKEAEEKAKAEAEAAAAEQAKVTNKLFTHGSSPYGGRKRAGVSKL